tara:strand:+ start:208 stop:576 length:369 start_codon:yes stop_codon:yes gene_type:complete
MIASAEVGGGRLNESGVWKNAATESWELVPVSMVQVTGVGTDVLRVQLPLDQTMLDNKHMFSLAWNCTDILAAEPGYGAEATDAATGCRYYAQAQAIGDGQYKVRVDCMERMWFWLELHVVM